MNTSWQPVGYINPRELSQSRVQLHYAIQLIAATGAALAEPQPDYSHTSLYWNSVLHLFVGRLIQAATPFQVALEPINLTAMLLDQQGETISTLPLPQKTMAEGLDWLKGTIAQLGADADRVVWLSYPPDDFPDHPVAHGAPFDTGQNQSLGELVSYYANTAGLFQEIVAITPGASPVCIWPHHFDMATLLTLPHAEDGVTRTVGVGMSPGDASYDEPYWYVTPYPYPAIAGLPEVAGDGFWHTQHWVGAVLTASQVRPQDGDAQQEQVRAFLMSAIAACYDLLQIAAAV
jgi:hypothetical protein